MTANTQPEPTHMIPGDELTITVDSPAAVTITSTHEKAGPIARLRHRRTAELHARVRQLELENAQMRWQLSHEEHE